MKCCDDRLNPPRIPETLVIHREAAAYWVPRFRGGRQLRLGQPDGRSPYPFFFTSLTLEKVIPSARSRV